MSIAEMLGAEMSPRRTHTNIIQHGFLDIFCKVQSLAKILWKFESKALKIYFFYIQSSKLKKYSV